jgi:hypothetical protein
MKAYPGTRISSIALLTRKETDIMLLHQHRFRKISAGKIPLPEGEEVVETVDSTNKIRGIN